MGLALTHALGGLTRPLGGPRNQITMRSIFRKYSTGIWYDPQDLTTLYQDAAGTLPVYRPGTGLVDPPVGLMLDKSGGGYHASQSTTTARPTLSGRYNLLTATKDFANATWGKSGLTTADNQTHYALYETATTSYHALSYPSLTYSSALIAKYKIKPNGRKNVCLYFGGAGGASGQIFVLDGDGSVHSDIKLNAVVYTAATIEAVEDGWYIISITGTRGALTDATPLLTIHPDTAQVNVAAPSYPGDPTKGILIQWADIRVKRDGSSLPAYQRVDSANTYDTAGFPLYLRRDRVDDDLIVQAPAITGQTVWGSIDTVDIAAATIAAGAYKPFGTITAGEPTCTQWIAIDGTLTAAEQAILERYVYSKSKLQVGV